MSLFLILHKVRGERAWDIAERLPCPICEPAQQGLDHGTDMLCEHEEFWIVPTSGHRAYPFLTWPLAAAFEDAMNVGDLENHPNWPGLPDHYTVKQGKDNRKKATIEIDSENLLKSLGLVTEPKSNFKRRF